MTQPVVLNSEARSNLVLTCEHARSLVPGRLRDLGLAREQLEDHIGWDIGAAAVTEILAERFHATAVLSAVSRLVVDCNRSLDDPDLMVTVSDGVLIPGNVNVARPEAVQRIRDYYEPYHAAIDAILRGRHPTLLLSLHSFTPTMHGRLRDFDIGVLFDLYAAEAAQLGAVLAREGFRVRYNEPYSGLDGLIYSARRHGGRHAVRYLELEINNALLRDDDAVRAVAGRVACAIADYLEQSATD